MFLESLTPMNLTHRVFYMKKEKKIRYLYTVFCCALWKAVIFNEYESGRICSICDDRNVEIHHVKVVLDV